MDLTPGLPESPTQLSRTQTQPASLTSSVPCAAAAAPTGPGPYRLSPPLAGSCCTQPPHPSCAPHDATGIIHKVVSRLTTLISALWII